MLTKVARHFESEAAAFGKVSGMPGYLAGVYHAGEQLVVAHGSANVAAGLPMTQDTGFLLGSITKVITTTLLLQQVERGRIDLNKRVIDYLPDFTLANPEHAAAIRVQDLVTHTDGIDADIFFPDVNGPESLKVYVEQVARCGTLFEPGRYVSYSNPGFIIAGRLLEVVTGRQFHDLLQDEIYGPTGMQDSCASARDAILRRTAVGHFVDESTRAVRSTNYFMLPDSWSASGSTPIVTMADLLAFGRAHLGGGVAPTGKRILSTEWVQRMRVATHDMQTPNVLPIGLGWWLVPLGDVTGLFHAGASPGGTSYMLVVPQHDLVFAGFGNGPRAAELHDQLAMWLLRDYLGLRVPDLIVEAVQAGNDLAQYEGTFRSHQTRVDVRAVDGQLEQTVGFEPIDAEQDALLRKFSGGQLFGPPLRFVPVGKGLFAPANVPFGTLTGIRGRTSIISFHGAGNSHVTYRSWAQRIARRHGAV